MEKEYSLKKKKNGARTTEHPMQKKLVKTLSYVFHQLNSQWILHTNAKSKTIKLPEENKKKKI